MEKGKILVIDDSSENCELAKIILTRQQYEVISAESGEEGLKKALEFLPDIILLDIMMPGISGLEVCKIIKKKKETLENTKIIMISAKAATDDIVNGLSLGADDYLSKPYEPEELVARVKVQFRSKKIEDMQKKLLEEIQEDLKLGALMQDSFLPGEQKVVNYLDSIGYDVVIFNKAPTTISGDFVFPKEVSDRSAGLFFADTCGHGIPAALISMRILSILENIRSPARYPSEFLSEINRELFGLIPRGRFIAASYAIFSREGVVISNAGQPYPVLICGGEVKEMEINGFPLGQMKADNYGDKKNALSSGDRVILYTDGLTEAVNSEKELFGKERLLEVLSAEKDKSIEEIKDSIMQTFKEFVGDVPVDDDITLAIFEKN